MAKITFENGTVVNFDGTPTPKDIEEVAKSLKLKPQQSQKTQQPQKSLTEGATGKLPGIKQATQVGTGIGTAIGKAGLNVGKASLKVAQGISNLGGKLGLGRTDYTPQINAIDKIKTDVYETPFQKELDTTGGKVGEVIGSVAPYFASGGASAKFTNNAIASVPKFKGAGALRTVMGGLSETASNFLQSYLLTGGDREQARKQALIAGSLKTVTGGLGEVFNATKLPQKLMAGIYKSDKKEIGNIFDNLDNGKTKVGQKKLSQWALEKNLKGSLEDQARQVKGIIDQSENSIIKSATSSKTRIPVETNLFKLAQKIQTDFQDVGRGEIAQKADKFLRSIKNNSTDVKSAIEFRRLIDNTLRTKSSFNNPALADNLAYWAEDLRGVINKVGKIGAINKDYTQAIKAREALIKVATSLNNTKALGALESYALGGGIITGQSLPAIGVIAGKRALQSPVVSSNLAQKLKNLPKSSASGASLRSIISRGLSGLGQ